MTPQHHLPADIERTSFNIITEELEMMGLTPPPDAHEAVVKRVIHTTADSTMRGISTLPPRGGAGRQGPPRRSVIVTDRIWRWPASPSPVWRSWAARPAVIWLTLRWPPPQKKKAGTTRAVAAMKRQHRASGAILAVGNAPTALLTIAEQIESGLRPALVISNAGGLCERGGEQGAALRRLQ